MLSLGPSVLADKAIDLQPNVGTCGTWLDLLSFFNDFWRFKSFLAILNS